VRIPPLLLRTLILRGLVLWFLARVMAIVVLAWADISGGSPLQPVWTLAVAASLVLADLHRRKELLLLHNLGVATAPAIVIGTIPAFLFESALLLWRA
jgi:hypothetical protein